MVNYETRVAALEAKGILDKNDANLLKRSLKQNVATLPKRRNYLFEMVGLLLFGAITFYLALQVGMVESDGSIEDVSQTLNALRSGMSTSHTFLLFLLGFGTATYLGLYLLVHRYYNAWWRIQEQMSAAGMLIADLETRQSQMDERLRMLASQAQNGKKTAKTVMQITAELDRELGVLQQEYAALQAECRQKRVAFPYTLAAMAGIPPECQ